MGLATSDWLFLFGIVALTMLFLGPGLWSNHEEMPIVYLWRRLRRKGPRKPKPPEDPGDRYL